MKKILVTPIVAMGAIFVLNSCSSGGGGGGSATTVAGIMSAGVDGSVSTIQSAGNSIGSGSFHVPFGIRTLRAITKMNAATKCDSNGTPGDDDSGDHDGQVEPGETYNQNDNNFALQSFYCSMAADTDGPEAVSGAVSTIKTVVCAVEKQIGTLAFNNVPVSITSLTIDTSCTSQSDIEDMGGAPGATSVTLPVAATITSALNPTFPEAPSNTHYTHGIRIASNDGTSLTFVLLAKFDSTDTDPVENGNFEFATYGTGTFMQGTAVETTAGRISGGTSATKHLWYEFRANRMKSSLNDAICPNDSSSCGFSRHIRFSTDISFSNGDIDDVSNFSGLLADGSDDVGSGGMSDNARIMSATGSLSTGGGITGMIWTSSTSPKDFSGVALSGMTAGTKTCVSSGSPVSTTCGNSALAPSGNTDTFFKPANNSTWFSNASTHGGIGFTGAVTLDDEQFAN